MWRILRAFAWMRWRVLLNSFERTGARDTIERLSLAVEQIGPIIAGVLLVPSLLGMAALSGLAGHALAVDPQRALTFEILRFLSVAMTALAIIGPIVLPVMERANAVRLLLLPIPRATLYVAQISGALADPWTLVVLPVGAVSAPRPRHRRRAPGGPDCAGCRPHLRGRHRRAVDPDCPDRPAGGPRSPARRAGHARLPPDPSDPRHAEWWHRAEQLPRSPAWDAARRAERTWRCGTGRPARLRADPVGALRGGDPRRRAGPARPRHRRVAVTRHDCRRRARRGAVRLFPGPDGARFSVASALGPGPGRPAPAHSGAVGGARAPWRWRSCGW